MRWLKSSISILKKKKKRILSLWVKAIKCWPWLMRWFESLIKCLIEPNTPTLLYPMRFLLIFNQLLNQQNITVNLLNLCPFPEPNSRVLELYTHSFSSSFIQTVKSSQDKTFLSHPIRMHRPHAPTCPKAKTCCITRGSVSSCIQIQCFFHVDYVTIYIPL